MNYALRIPDYYKEDIENLKGDVSINQFIINALAEKISSLKTVAYLQERADKGSAKHALVCRVDRIHQNLKGKAF